MTDAVLDALSGLPDWPCLLTLTDCAWPMRDNERWEEQWPQRLVQHPVAQAQGWVVGESCIDRFYIMDYHKGVLRERKEGDGAVPPLRKVLRFQNEEEADEDELDQRGLQGEPFHVVLHRPGDERLEAWGLSLCGDD